MAIEGNENQMVMPVSPMNETTDERTRMEIQNCIQRIQGM